MQSGNVVANTVVRKRLSPEETEEFNRLTRILPHLVRSLDEADKLKKDHLRAATSTERTVKSSRNRPDVGIVSERGRRDSDASSDITLADDADDLKKGGQFAKEDDSDSVCSVDSLGYEYEPYVLTPRYLTQNHRANSDMKTGSIS